MSQNGDSPPVDAPFVTPNRPQVGAPRLVLVAALASNRVIGARGALPWRLPEDLRRFKSLTLGHPVIMGRRTWESLARRPLPGRRNFVVTRRAGFEATGAEVADSLDAALARCAGEPIAFVIGGAELYAAALPRAEALELTEIHRDFEGDARFPEFPRREWREAKREPQAGAGGLRFDFVRYERAR